MITAQDELDRFLDRKGVIFADALLNLPRAKMQGSQAHQKALWDLAGLIQKTLILCDLHGRKRLLMEAEHLSSTAQFSEIPANANPLGSLPFDEAVEDVVSRDPKLARGYEAVSKLYNSEHVFALAKSADLKVTERVQDEVQKLIAGGKPVDAETAIQGVGDWSKSYAGVIYRTNAASSYNAGRFEQANDPDVREVIPALEYNALLDDRTRPNHAAAHGLIADTLDPIWHKHRPPQGYNCRCAANFISVFELERRGLLQNGRVVRYQPPNFGQARPDSGFRTGRVDF